MVHTANIDKQGSINKSESLGFLIEFFQKKYFWAVEAYE